MPSSLAPVTSSAGSGGGTAAGTHAVGLKAVLWDMDGTLVDTEPYWIAAEQALVAAHGGTWSDTEAMALVGQSLVYSSHVLQNAGVGLSSREIIDHLTGEVIRRVREEIPWRPGARELLQSINEAGIPCALVTMSEGPLAAEIVRNLPESYFEFLVTGDSVRNGKPHPEPYLTAVARLAAADPSVTAPACVALEDSVPGVASARAAGVVTVGIPHVVPLQPDDGLSIWPTLAGRTVEDLRRLFPNDDGVSSPSGAAE
ncbi:MAG: HAD family hydrolase [Actinomycetales bacterium]